MSKVNKITNQTTVLLEGSKIELLATYSAEYYPSQKEEEHGLHETGGMWLITLKDVCLRINDEEASLLALLTTKQKAAIVYHINSKKELCSI
ncbi:MAG: hypothetical protein JSS64_03560 [Bacteroidetes bacterium]|nr:hypothetical protein [Bacteroidota bacterium]